MKPGLSHCTSASYCFSPSPAPFALAADRRKLEIRSSPQHPPLPSTSLSLPRAQPISHSAAPGTMALTQPFHPYPAPREATRPLSSLPTVGLPTPTPTPTPTPARNVMCCGYVGQGARSAAQYHECDFDWHEHARAVRNIVEAQAAQAAARLAASRHNGAQASEEPSEVPLRQTHGDYPPARGEEHLGDPPAHGRQEAASTSASSSRDCSLQLRPAREAVHQAAPFQGQRYTARQIPSPTSQSQQHAAATVATSHTAPASNTSNNDGYTRSLEERCTSTATEVQLKGDPSPPSDNSSANTHARCAPDFSADTSARCGSETATTATTSAVSSTTVTRAYEGGRWEEFYRAHPTARFFKERRYLLLEFPELLRAGHVAEIGCGCGSSILPVLKANTGCRTTCTDISPTCLVQLQAAAAAEGVSADRLTLFPADATDPLVAPAFDGIEADALLIMFTLSAVPPAQQLVMLQHAWRALAPGGRLLIRDHGLYDMVQLRIPADQWVADNLYKRGDGTMAYFFSAEDIADRAAAAGFQTAECKYVTVVNRNRKSGLELRRVFVHGVFVKPPADYAVP